MGETPTRHAGSDARATCSSARNDRMKNATIYAKKVKKFMGSLPKPRASAARDDSVIMLVEAVLAADAARKDLHRAVATITNEFVDLNELRVSPAKEIVAAMGRNFPQARTKAYTLTRCLNSVFDKSGRMDIAYMKDLPRKDLRRHLAEIGLPPFSVAYVMLMALDLPALPVDTSLVDALKMNDVLGPCTVEEAQAFLERTIPAKQLAAAHEFFRAVIEKNAKAIARWAKTHPDLATPEPTILPPPKVKMLVKHQPLPGAKDDEGEDVTSLDVVLDDADSDAPLDDDADLDLPPVDLSDDEDAAPPPAKKKPTPCRSLRGAARLSSCRSAKLFRNLFN